MQARQRAATRPPGARQAPLAAPAKGPRAQLSRSHGRLRVVAAAPQSLELFSPSKVGAESIVTRFRRARVLLALLRSRERDDRAPNHAIPRQINVFLRVIRRREDGYHDLASLFHVRVRARC